jgi:hypothetical protein
VISEKWPLFTYHFLLKKGGKMRHRVTLYIYRNGRLLVFKRIREDGIHHVAIGGGVEPGETSWKMSTMSTLTL